VRSGEGGEVVVVGGTNGIGLAIARALAARGDSVLVAGRSLERAQSAADEIGPSCHGLAVDLTEPDDLPGALSTVESVSALGAYRCRTQ
jgi:NAD(P)-dependent dehydrogenase (short-subunit alcohol dehydrogenase family)